MKTLLLVILLAASFVCAENVLYNNSGTTATAVSLGLSSLTLTNGFTAKIATWSGPTNTYDLSVFRQQYTTTKALCITSFDSPPAAGFENASVLTITNSSASDVIFYLPSTITTDDGARSYTVTNASQRKFSFNKDDAGYHCVTRSFF